MPETPVGKVEHYYPKVKAAAVRLNKRVKVGDKVHIVGHGDDFTEKVTSMQLDHQPIQEGAPGQSIGLAVKERVHEGDDVLLVTPEASWSKDVPGRPKAKPAKKAKKAKKAARKSKPRKAKRGKKSNLSKKQVAQRKYASRMRGIRKRAKGKKGGKGRIAKRSSAARLRRKLGLKKKR